MNNVSNGGNEINQVLSQMRVMAAAAEGRAAGGPTPGEASGADFGDMLKASIDQVNGAKQHAGNLTAAFQRGDPDVALSEVMVALQKASLSFDAMTEVRNKLLSAYQDVMNMQV